MSFLLKDIKEDALELIQVEGAAGKVKKKAYDGAITRSVETYSRDRPYEKVLDLTGDGTGLFLLSSLTGYIDGFSGDVRIEYPIATDGEQSFLERRVWSFALTPAGKSIRLHEYKPNGTNDKARFIFRTRHIIHASNITLTTVIETDRGAFAKLVAAEICGLFASFHTHTGEGQLVQADVTYFKSKRSEFEGREKVLRGQYATHIGKGDNKDVMAASVIKNFDVGPSAGVIGLGSLTHNRRYR